MFSKLKKRGKSEDVVADVDRILRPEGKLNIVRDTTEIINELESLRKSMQWEVHMIYTKDTEGMWRPTELETVDYAIV